MSSVVLGNKLLEPLCYVSMIALSIVSSINEKLVPLHVQITVFSLAIITVGSYRSLSQMAAEMKKALIDEKKEGEEGSQIETVTNKDALQFPLYAGGMLCGLYALIKFFGKDAVNYVILVYIAIGGGTGMKALLLSLTGNSLSHLDKKNIIDIKWKFIDLQVTILDIVGFVMSCISVGFYVWSKSWIYNNLLAVVFCVHAL
jgi:minor histocompatibility antigen H13